MKTISTGQGYLLNDNSASGGVKVEADMLGCNHCQALIEKAKWKAGQTGAYCRACDSPICTTCAMAFKTQGCVVFSKKFEAALNDLHRRQQNARIMGI